jgi:hypothetical protein
LAAIEALKLQKEQEEERARRLAMKLKRGKVHSVPSKVNSNEIVLEEPSKEDSIDSREGFNRKNQRSPGLFDDEDDAGDESVPPWAAADNDDLDDQLPCYGDDDDDDGFDRAVLVAPLDSTSPPKWSAPCSEFIFHGARVRS